MLTKENQFRKVLLNWTRIFVKFEKTMGISGYWIPEFSDMVLKYVFLLWKIIICVSLVTVFDIS